MHRKLKDKIREQVMQTIGTASMCWTEPPTAVFDSTQAIKIGEELCEFINTELDKLSDPYAGYHDVEEFYKEPDPPKIVCLCGSTRFMDAFFEAGWNFTLKGYIVLSVGVCKHAKDHGAEALGQDVAEQLDELHLRKIDLADEIFVLNVGNYIGESTRGEIEYAKLKNKPISYLEPINE